jgi:hypothetical protein
LRPPIFIVSDPERNSKRSVWFRVQMARGELAARRDESLEAGVLAAGVAGGLAKGEPLARDRVLDCLA